VDYVNSADKLVILLYSYEHFVGPTFENPTFIY